MLYQHIDELPNNVRAYLPTDAREVYLKAFNCALQEYANKVTQWAEFERAEAVAHKVAWSAIKDRYEKNPESGFWYKKTQ